ncbi:MAG: YlxM family DNA-binding protein [Anaerovoracaceae bacterium]
MDDIARESLLYDFYGELLTEKKRQVVEMSHDSDMSLSEIADITGVSRAAVHDSLKAAEKQLANYEEKLGLVQKYIDREKKVSSLLSQIDGIREMNGKKAPADDISKALDDLADGVRSLSGE